ncbi:hypothetical protein HMPREF1578_00983, partial [Gardnerella pickettii JCP8017B]
ARMVLQSLMASRMAQSRMALVRMAAHTASRMATHMAQNLTVQNLTVQNLAKSPLESLENQAHRTRVNRPSQICNRPHRRYLTKSRVCKKKIIT